MPAVARILEHPLVAGLAPVVPASVVTDAARAEIALARVAVAAGHPAPSVASIAAAVARRAGQAHATSLPAVVNCTGIVLHTGLGRAVLAEAAREAIARAASGHVPVELDLATGERGSRHDHVRGLLRELTSAESALVVNNNAGALLLAVAALAAGGEAIVSRGELVEIGGAFRMPDVIAASGARMVEVGTTNRTRVSDYARAMTERTSILLRCHPSNFAIVGFAETAPLASLVELGRRHNVPVVYDLGSGALIDTAALGAGESTTLGAAIAAGCDVVTASGDKLLGGPQAGIIVGRADLIERMASHPLARALRVDKLTLAGLEATLRLYRDPSAALQAVPTLRYLGRAPDELARLAARLADAVRGAAGAAAQVDVAEGHSQVGGGSLPGERLATFVVRVRPADLPEGELAAALRRSRPAVIGRLHEGALLLDPRSMEEGEIPAVEAAFLSVWANAG